MKWFLGERHEPGTTARWALRDSLFLTTVVALSCLPYLTGLGLYSDDWAFLSELHNTRGSFRRMYDALMPMGLATRPVQALVLVGLYSVFGLEPLGYHVFNSAVLVAATLLFYVSLRSFGCSRIIAVVVPMLFALLPHYSTDRFWIAAYQANVSICLYFLSLFADLRFVSLSGGRRWWWKALGAIALLGSVLAYEVTAALFLVNVLLLWYHATTRRPQTANTRPMATALALGGNVILLALATVYKITTTERTTLSGGYLPRALRIVREAVPVHFGEYGAALPVRVGQALRDRPDALVLAASAMIGLVAWVYLVRQVRPRDGAAPFDRRASWVGAILLGGILFVAGYGVALTTYEVGFHTTSTNNRTAIGAAIGVSWVFAGVIGWLSTWLPSDRRRWAAFSALVALLAASSTLLTGTVAGFWVTAARRQQTVIARIQQRFPELPSGTMLLLDGLCPFEGPAVVFATSWDVTGMLQLRYADRSLKGDVVKPNTALTDAGVRTTLFDDVINLYPYGERLVAYHLPTDRVVPLRSAAVAREYLRSVSGPNPPGCPPYTDGDGVPVF